MAAVRDQLEVGVLYWPAAVGPYLWHEFDRVEVERDLGAVAARRIPLVRVLLSWDAFMPTDRAPSPRRLRDLEILLNAARELGLRVVPTLFAQSIGDCVLLPPYAIDRRAPRRGVRCVTDARVVAGGPKDIYADPLMLEVQVRWLDALLAAFAGHPAVDSWDLGYDPATAIRPRRIAEMAAWASLLAERVHAQGERCRLTLGQGDVTWGRGVRPARMAEHVDCLGLALQPQRLALPGEPLDPGRAVFVTQLAQALAGPAVPLAVEVGIASGALTAHDRDNGADLASPDDARRCADRLVQSLQDVGVAGLHTVAWSDWGERLTAAPPADRLPWWSHLGIVAVTGVSKPIADAWELLAGRERAVTAASPYPAALDVDSYYANLPESLLDLRASWKRDDGDVPAILD